MLIKRRSRAVPTISSRIGDALLRRRGIQTTAAAPDDLKDGSVVALPKGMLPATDILKAAKVIGEPARQTEYLHVSDLLYKCVRKFALAESVGVNNAPASVSLWDSLVYAQGNVIHDVVKERMVKGGPRIVWGNWRCRCGTTVTTSPIFFSEVDQNKVCPSCRQPTNTYVEVPMRDAELKIVGTPDLISYIPSARALYINELKSISHDAWKELVRPHPDHVIQTLFYWHLMHRKKYRLANQTSVIYITKGWQFSGQAWKEFVVEDAASQVERLEPYLTKAKEMAEFRKGGVLPVRICSSPGETRAKACTMCTMCFSVSDRKPTEVNIMSALDD